MSVFPISSRLMVAVLGLLLLAGCRESGGASVNTTLGAFFRWFQEPAQSASPDAAASASQTDKPSMHGVGTASYDESSDTTSITHHFTADPNGTYRLGYRSSMQDPYKVLANAQGAPLDLRSSPDGVLTVTITEPGDKVADWSEGMIFQLDRQAAAGTVYNLPSAPPHLLAHYLPWFEDARRDGPTKPWDHWSWTSERLTHDPETLREDGLRDIAAAQYPLIGPYSSGDADVVRYHCEAAKAAGIEGLIVLWYGPGSPTDARIPLILDEAERAGLKVALCYEEKLNWPPYRNPNTRAEMVDSAAADLRFLLERYASHPAYLRRAGEPVVMQFNYWGTDRLGPRTFSPAEWSQIFGTLGQEVCYVRQNFDPAQHPQIAGSYHWWVTDESVLQLHQNRVSAAVGDGQLVFHAGYIAPGFDDAGTDSWGSGNRRHQPRDGAETLKGTMSRALVGDPEIVQIVTWNDFNEGTEIEPTVEEGFLMLDTIGAWWAGVKNRSYDPAGVRAALRGFLNRIPEARRTGLPVEALRQAGVEE